MDEYPGRHRRDPFALSPRLRAHLTRMHAEEARLAAWQNTQWTADNPERRDHHE